MRTPDTKSNGCRSYESYRSYERDLSACLNKQKESFMARFTLFARILRCLALLLATASIAGAASLDLPDARLEFEETQGRLVSLRDMTAGHEHIAQDAVGSLWLVELPESAGGALRPSDASEFDWHQPEDASEALRLTWRGFGRPALPDLSVEAELRYDPLWSAAAWKIRVSGLSDTTPTAARFPRFPELARQENEALAVPYWMGEMTTHPRTLLSPEPGHGARREFEYPGLLSLQCMAFYQQDGPGLFIASDDTGARSKRFAVFGDGREGIGLEVIHLPGADALKDGVYAPEYAVLSGVFQGDWVTVAERYRSWAMNQPWAHNSRIKQGGTPAWVTDTGFWVWNRGHSEGVLPPAAALQRYLDVPVSVFWHWWHGCAYDVGFPEYLPPREGADPFREAVRKAREQGLNPIVYMNQRLWGMTTESWTMRDAERYAVKKPDGTVQPEVYNTFTKSPNASMCMGTAFWRDTYAELADSVYNDLGVSGIYMDQACSSLVCYDKDHGHAPGGGTYWMEGFRSLEGDIRGRCPGVGLAGEGCGEAWLPHLDLMLSLQVSRERYAAPGEWEPIPFFHAVYHGYTVLYGNYASLTEPPYDPLWPAEFAPEQPLKLLDEKFRHQFRLEQARSFVWGQQPCLANFTMELFEQRAEDLAYIRQLAQLRRAALPYLLHGAFARPPRMDIPDMEIDVSRLSIYAGRGGSVQEYRKRAPQYLVCAWRAEDGDVAVAAANITDTDQTLSFRVTSAEQGLPAEGAIYKILPDGRTRLGAYEKGEAAVSDVLPGADACVYEFTKDAG